MKHYILHRFNKILDGCCEIFLSLLNNSSLSFLFFCVCVYDVVPTSFSDVCLCLYYNVCANLLPVVFVCLCTNQFLGCLFVFVL